MWVSKLGSPIHQGRRHVLWKWRNYFACTSSGAKKYGQIFRYKPSPNEGLAGEENDPGILELFIESQDLELLKACDNLTVAPWEMWLSVRMMVGAAPLSGLRLKEKCIRLPTWTWIVKS